MTNKRLYYLLVGMICLLFLGLLGGTYGANKLLTKQSNKLLDLKAKSAAVTQEQASLNNAKKEISKYSDLLKITKSVVPEDKDQAEAVRELVNIAENNSVSLASISFPNSTLGLTATGQSTATSTAPASAAPAAATTKASSKVGSLSQLIPVKNIPGVYQLIITVKGDPAKPVQYNQFVKFLSALEHNRRTAQVGSITIEPNADNRNNLTFTLTLSEYIKP